MKCFALLCLVGVAVASSFSGSVGVGLTQKLWRQGQEYNFRYEGRQLNGIPQLANNQYSGVGLSGDVKVQVTRDQYQPEVTVFTIRFMDAQYVNVNSQLQKDMESSSVAQTTWRNVVLPSLQPVPGQMKQWLEQPTQFKMHGISGKFESMTVGQQEQQWIVDFKKALVSIFQTKSISGGMNGGNGGQGMFNGNSNGNGQSSGQMSYWTTVEEALDGDCQVDYQVSQISNGQAAEMHQYFSEQCRKQNNVNKYIITKTRNVDSCTKRNVFNFYKPGFFRCPTQGASGSCEGQWSRTSITRYYACGQSTQQMQIQTILNEGELQQDLFGEKTEKFLTGSQQNLTLISTQPIHQHMQVSSGKTIQSLVYGIEQQEQVKAGIHYGYNGMQKQQELIKSQKVHEPRSLLSVGIQHQQMSSQQLRGNSGDIQRLVSNIVQTVEQLVDHDLEQPQNRANKEITMKALNLARGFYVLEQNELSQVYQQLKSKYQSQPAKLTTMKNVFFDTVIMGGSQNCVLFLKQKIQSQEVESQQLLNFFVFMPHYIITPSEIVLENIFELVKEIKQQRPVIYNQAVLSFSALIQRACLSQSRDASYPTQAYGQFCSPKSQIVEGKWIPYLQQQVYQSQQQLSQGNPEQMNLHLVALSTLRHQGAVNVILSVLDMQQQQQGNQGTQNPQAVELSRYIAVYGLSNAGQSQPKMAIKALSAILKNQSEKTEIRIAAFNAILKLNPELYVLQSIAAMTWRDSNKDVIDVINSGFFFLAHQSEIQIFEQYGSSIQRKAALLLPLLKWGRTLNQVTFYTGDKLGLLDVSYSSIRSWRFASNPSQVLPNSYYGRLTYLLNRYQFVVSETFYKVNGYDNLLQQLIEVIVPGTQHQTKSQVSEQILNGLNSEWKQIVQNLKMERRDQGENGQGALYMNFFEDFPMFASIHSTSSQMLRQKLSSILGSSPQSSQVCGQHEVNMQRFMDLSPSEYSVPSEMGLPIVIEVHMPAAVSLRGKINVQCGGQSQIVPNFEMDLKTLVIGQYAGWVGTVSPFTNEVLLTAVDQHAVLDIPVQTHVQFQAEQQKIVVSASLAKEVQQQEFDMIHFHVRPFTVRKAIYDLRPFSQLPQGQFKKIQSQTQAWSKDIELGQTSGLGLKIALATESYGPSMLNAFVRKLRMYNYNIVNAIRFGMMHTGVSEHGKPSLRSHLIKLTYQPQSNKIQSIQTTISLGYASKSSFEQQQQLQYHVISKEQQQQKESYPAWQQLLPLKVLSLPIGSQQVQGHSQRQQKIQQIFQQTGVKAGRVFVADLEVKLQGQGVQSTMHYDVKVCLGQNQDLQSKWNVQMSNQQQQSQVKISGFVKPQSQMPGLNIETLRQNPIQYSFENDVTVQFNGQTGTIKMQGSGSTSQQQIEVSRSSKEAKEYEHIKQRNGTLAAVSAAAHAVRLQATNLDKVDLTISFENMQQAAKIYQIFGVTNVKAMWWPYKETQIGAQPSQNKLVNKWSLQFHQQSNTVSGTLQEPQQGKQSQFQEVNMPYFLSYFVPLNGLSLAKFLKGQSPVPASIKKMDYACAYYKDLVLTFNGQQVPGPRDDCFHIMASDATKDSSFQVYARNINAQQPMGPKEVKVVYQNTNIILTQTGSSQFAIRVNGSHSQLPSSNQPKDITDGQGNLVATVYKNQNAGYELTTVFKGPSTRRGLVTIGFEVNGAVVYVDSSLRGQLAGICGQISADKLVDLAGPSKCLYSKPELFVASYRTSTKEKQCSQTSLKNELELENQQCKKVTHLTSKVGMSYQSLTGQCTQHVHLLLEKPTSLCVTKRPVPQCGAQCKPIGGSQHGLSEKSVSFVCLPLESKMAKIIESQVLQGQVVMNEISGLPTAFEVTMKLPRGCQAYSTGINGSFMY